MKEAAVANMRDVMCRFSAPNAGPCVAYADQRNARGYCSAHEEIYIHDCAIAFRRKAKKDPAAAERWAIALGLPLHNLKQMAESLPKGKRPIAVEVQ